MGKEKTFELNDHPAHHFATNNFEKINKIKEKVNKK